MNKKMICIIISTLLITTVAVPISGLVMNNNQIISSQDRGYVYVDDDRPPEWYDEFHVKTIQEGIDNASTDDTVFVYNGQYNENVVVDKTLNIEGEDRDNTIIHGVNGLDNTVEVTSDWCNISEFTVENGGTLSGGIRVMADHTTIYDSIIDDNTDIGIFVQSSEYTSIHDNSFSENNQGIYLYQALYTTVSNNEIQNNYVNGILALYSDHNDILNNQIKSNSRVGIWLNNDCDENTVNNNTVMSNGEEGIRLWLSDDNTISENTVSENGAPDEDGGIVCYESNGNEIYDNTINSNENQGVFIENSGSNEVYRNCIYDNNMYGINCKNSDGNIIYHNNIFDNTQNSNDDSTDTNTWDNDANQGNYWDDYTGKDDDGDGIGDKPYEIPGGNNEDRYPLMTEYGPPHADFTHDVDGRNVTFNASRSYDYDGYIDDYDWEFGDNTTGNGKLVEHTYPDDGTYYVTLNVTDDEGKKDTTIKPIIVDSIPPDVIDNSPEFGTTGDPFTFNATVTDNVEVSYVQVGYRFGDEGNDQKILMENVAGNHWEATILINHSLDTLHYFLYAEDTFGNGNCSITKDVPIYDNDLPEISEVKAVPPVAPVGYNVNVSAIVTDNIELVEVRLHIIYPDSSVQNFSIIHSKIGDRYFSNKTYTDDGTYKYHIWAKDSSDLQNTSDEKEFDIVLGSPPEKPQINGPNGGKPRVNYTFEFKSKDGEGHQIYYKIDWDDGKVTDWFGPYDSGTWQSRGHEWAKKGTYEVKVKAKDTTGLESDWAVHTINVPRLKQGQQKETGNTNNQTVVSIIANKTS